MSETDDTSEILIPLKAPANIKINPDTVPIRPNVNKMSDAIYNLISKPESNSSINDYVKDYIFLCFFIGNDFVPHHPAVNIRTTGIEFLIDVYRNSLKPNEE